MTEDVEPVRAALARLPFGVRESFEGRSTATVRPASKLRVLLDQYLVELQSGLAGNEFVDLPTARVVAKRCLVLLDVAAEKSPKDQRLAATAVEYFLAKDDGEHDTDSIIGFDDDLEVVQAVESALGIVEGTEQ